MIAIACDHAGIDLKPYVIEALNELCLPYRDFGAFSHDSVDYPAMGELAVRAVASGDCELGILMCGTGVGIGIAANKVQGVRCVICSDVYSALMSREHNDANMLTMSARMVGSEVAKLLMRTFMTGKFLGERHARRVGQIMTLDAGGTLQA